jgi:hypothetical protein
MDICFRENRSSIFPEFHAGICIHKFAYIARVFSTPELPDTKEYLSLHFAKLSVVFCMAV